MDVRLVRESDSGSAKLSGGIDNDNAVALLQEGYDFLEQADGPVVFDFSQVESAQSVALSLMLRWTEKAASSGRDIRFIGVSRKLQDLAGVSELEEVLPLHS
jgi:phospholipid transport system transporter-binding protein